MIDETKKLIEQGNDHFEGAKILFSKGYPTDVVGLLLNQSLEAYFKGFLAHLKIDPQEDEDLITLFNLIIQKDKGFGKFENYASG